MIICHCHGISDRELREAANRGEHADDAARSCRAGTSCHGCLPAVREILREANPRKALRVESKE